MPTDDVHSGRLAALRVLAECVLGSPADAEQFLTTPHALLDQQRPIALAATEAGARRVDTLRWRLEYSLPV